MPVANYPAKLLEFESRCEKKREKKAEGIKFSPRRGKKHFTFFKKNAN